MIVRFQHWRDLVFLRTLADVILISDVMVHTPGPGTFNVYSNYTISFVFSCVTSPLCDLSNSFSYDDINREC